MLRASVFVFECFVLEATEATTKDEPLKVGKSVFLYGK